MLGTSVVVLCVGAETYQRPWVRYELEKAHREGKGILAIDMAGMRNLWQASDYRGPNPLGYVLDQRGNQLSSYSKYISYDWLDYLGREYGRYHIDDWIEKAASLAGR